MLVRGVWYIPVRAQRVLTRQARNAAWKRGPEALLTSRGQTGNQGQMGVRAWTSLPPKTPFFRHACTKVGMDRALGVELLGVELLGVKLLGGLRMSTFHEGDT